MKSFSFVFFVDFPVFNSLALIKSKWTNKSECKEVLDG